jgi:hypothetical protein
MVRTSSRWQVLLGALLLAGATTLAAQGCTVTSGDGDPTFSDSGTRTDTGTTDSGTGGDSTTPPVNACNECLFSKCSAQHAACMAEAECSAIYFCAIANPAGAPACADAHPTGKATAQALADCDQFFACDTSSSCKSTCNYGASECAGAPDAGEGQTCPQCTASKCATESAKCSNPDEPCAKLGACYASCTDAATQDACIADCEDVHSAGKTDQDALATCTTTKCGTECK